MLASVGKIFSNVRSYYNEINSATLTGAIDILVVEQPDGTYQSSPFHVRFGKLGVIRSREKVVYIEINGEPSELQMKLGNAGEAFFVQEVLDKWEGPDYLATSPIISSPIKEAMERETGGPPEVGVTKPKRQRQQSELSHSSSSSASDLSRKVDSRKYSFEPINQMDDELMESGGMFDIEVSDDERNAPIPDLESGMSKSVSLPLIEETSQSRIQNWKRSSSIHPFSDTDITPLVSPAGSRPHTPKSDTECEYTDRKAADETNEPLKQWNWGELPESSQLTADDLVTHSSKERSNARNTDPNADAEASGLWSFMRSTKKLRHKPEQGGIYLDDLNVQEMDPEVAALYFPKTQKHSELRLADEQTIINMLDEDSESGRGASLPHSPSNMETEPRVTSSPASDTGTMKDHEIGNVYGDIALSLCGNLAEQNQVSVELFNEHQILYDNFIENPSEILQNPHLVVRVNDKYHNWPTAAPMLVSMLVFQQTLPSHTQEQLIKTHMPYKKSQKGRSSWWPFSRSAKEPLEDVEGSNTSTPNGSPKKHSLPVERRSSESGDEADDEKEEDRNRNLSEPLSVEKEPTPGLQIPERYVKTLRLTSEQLELLHLHEGENEIEFSVTTAYQGTSRCSAHIYLWKHTDMIIISDIDGTITRSDVLGQLLPMVGKDWSQSGVTELFTKIAQNGYKFAYLSSRAIGQAQITRDFLRSVRQGACSLPIGPLFLNPSSLMNAFHKEMIARKPEEFKISCLRDIKSLFSSPNSLYAGFGNRINDSYAYGAVGIPKSRMFSIDHCGRLKADFSNTFQSSYAHLRDVTDHYFPPVDSIADQIVHHSPEEYSNFTYWRDPIPTISLELPDID